MHKQFSISGFFKDKPEGSIFIFSDSGNITYKEALQKISTFNVFNNYIPQTNNLAGVIPNNSPDMIFLVLAMWSRGIIPVMINNRLTKSEINTLINDIGCEYIFAGADFDSTGIKAKVDFYPEYGSTSEDLRVIDTEETAVIIFTSGSSGNVKGVELTFRTFVESALLQNEFLNQSKGEKWLLSLPFYHIGGFSILLRAILNNTSIIIPKSLQTSDLCTAIRSYKPHYFSLVGTQLKRMLDEDFYPGEQVKNILIGGGFTDDEIIINALDKGWNISKVYGSTETASFIAAADKNILRHYPSAAGKELKKDSILLFNTQHHPVLNSIGEIVLNNIPVMKGYFNNPELTKEKFSNGSYITGDIGYKDQEGILFLQMRRTDLIVSGGENIDPREIEAALIHIEGITDAYVFGLADKEWGQVPAAVVSSSISYTSQEIKKILKEKLAGFKLPSKYYFIERIPRTELGKIQLPKLMELISGK